MVMIIPPSAMLAKQHAHARDRRVRFLDDQKQHEYVILVGLGGEIEVAMDGNRKEHGGTYVSVTTACHQGFTPFDSETKTVEIAASCRPGSYYYGLSAHEMARVWTYARDAGTLMHEQIERFYNGEWSLDTLEAQERHGLNTFSWREQDHFRAFVAELPRRDVFYNGRWTREQLECGTTSLLTPELEQFLLFQDDHPHLKPYRTEWIVFDETLRLVGAIDMVFWDERLQCHCIYDWKRTRALRTSNWEGTRGSAWWSEHLVDCNVEHYRLQLSTYKLILERQYGLTIAEMWLVRCHPEATRYEKRQVHWDASLMHNMVAARMHQLLNGNSTTSTINTTSTTPYVDSGYQPILFNDS